MTHKVKDKKKLFGRNVISDNFIKRKNLNYRGLYEDKESGSSIFSDPDSDSGDPKRPDPTGYATLVLTFKYAGLIQ